MNCSVQLLPQDPLCVLVPLRHTPPVNWREKRIVLNLMEWVAYGVTVYSNTPTHQQERVPTESEILERGSGSVTVAVHPGFFAWLTPLTRNT